MVKDFKIKILIKQLIKNLKEKGVFVERLILFGSYAHGKQKYCSDIDIAVISSTFEGKGILKRQELLAEALLGIDAPIETLGYTPKECRKPSPMSFVSEILSTGKLIYKL